MYEIIVHYVMFFIYGYVITLYYATLSICYQVYNVNYTIITP